ncbi:MAG: hypothetical protein IPI50_05760 [Saprospiraceae bacterium]|nr:hypothetical protein [Saprospiraceae bacterium]
MDKFPLTLHFPKISPLAFILFGLTSMLSLKISSQSNYSIVDHKIQLFGTSNVHDWVLNVENSKGSGNFHLESNQLKKVTSLKFEIPVLKIKSARKSKTMDEKVYGT